MAVTFVPSPYLVAQVKVDPGIGSAMEMIGEAYLDVSRDLAPVGETGDLKASLRRDAIPGNGQRISVNVDYWNFPEFGMRNRNYTRTPYLRPPMMILGLHQ